MSSSKISFLALVLFLIIGCSTPPQPPVSTVSLGTLPDSTIPTLAAPASPTSQPTEMPTRAAAARAKPTIAPQPQPTTAESKMEPLRVVKVVPQDKAKDIPVDGKNSPIRVRFNYPVVPLSDLNSTDVMTHPLSIQPYVPYKGYWTSAYTYVMVPHFEFDVATTYTISVKPTHDLLGHSLDAYAWSFETVRPKINYTDPPNRKKPISLGVMEPVTIHFNTPMDRSSVETRMRVIRKRDGWAALGDFKWDKTAVSFIPRYPLDEDTSYVLQLAPGAQDLKRITTAEGISVTFKTYAKFALLSTAPQDQSKNSGDVVSNGMRLNFTQPPDGDKLQVSIVPTITHQSVNQYVNRHSEEYSNVTISGGWQPSTAYTVTIGSDSRSIYNERLGRESIIHFKTAPLPSFMHINLPELGLYDTNGPQKIFATYTNVSRIDYEMYRVPQGDLFKLLRYSPFGGPENIQEYVPNARDVYKLWSQTFDTPLDQTQVVSTTLADAVLDKPKAGVYVLRATAPETENVDKTLLLVSPMNLSLKFSNTEVLVWVTNLASGKPVANQPLKIYSSLGNVISEGSSDKDGLFRTPLKWEKDAESGRLFVVSEDEVGNVIAATASDWNWGITAWDYDLPTEYGTRGEQVLGNVYTDRAIYRAGQTVYFKGILRTDADPQPEVPLPVKNISGQANASQTRKNVTEVVTRIYNSQGQEISQQTLEVNEFGTFNGQVVLNENAPTGEYRVETDYGMVYFTVNQYRKPEFQVNLATDQTAYLNGDGIRLTVDSTYFFGGPVTEADVTWRVLTENYLVPPNIEGWWDFNQDQSYYDGSGGGAQQVADGTGKTNSSGTFTVTIPAKLDEYTLSQNFTIEAEIVDANHQVVANRIIVPVHRGAFYLGIRPDSYVGTVNRNEVVNLVTVKANPAPDESPLLANQPVTVSIYAGNWYNYRELRNGVYEWRNSYTETLVTTTNIITNENGRGSASFTPTRGGEYRILAESVDEHGNEIKTATRFYASGYGYAGWKIDNTNRLSVMPDKKSYQPGDTAELLVLAPFSDSEALVTVERGGILEVQRIHVQNNTASLRIPIRGDYAPNVFVSVILVKGRGGDSTFPQFKMGYVNLAVETVAQTLKVELDAQCAEPVTYDPTDTIPVTRPCQPNDTATLTLHATDYLNRPARAEFSVAVVDKAIQSLMGDKSTPLLSTFYQPRGLTVQTATTLLNSIERDNTAIRTGAKGGGGGGGAEFLIRRDFRDTAYWNPTVVTNDHGSAQVQVKLPDNLTTWNVVVKGVTLDTRLGEAQLDLLSTRPLLIRPVTPRFFVVGDQTRLEAVVNNNTDAAVTARVTLFATGITVGEDATQTITIAAHNKNTVTWETTTEFTDEATVRFTATTGTLRDGVELKLPVQIPQETQSLFSIEPVETRLTKLLDLASNTPDRDGRDTLQVHLTPSLAAASRDALDYLESYPWECSEQTTSKFLPNIATYLAVKRLGMDNPKLYNALQSNVTREIQRLYFLQHDDGGWGWWRDGESRAALTAYALFALYTARTAEFPVSEDVVQRAEKYLFDWLDKPLARDEEFANNERAFTLYVLTEMGRDTQGRVVKAFDERASLDTFARAFLLLAMHKLDLPQQAALLQEINQAATVESTYVRWVESTPDTWNMNTNTRTQAITILALARVDPKNPLLPRAVKWLMDARKLEYQAVHWDTTQETAWGVMGLTEWMVATGELQGNYAYQVVLNGQLVGSGNVTPANVQESRTLRVNISEALQNSADELVVTRDSTQGALYASAYLRKYVDPTQMTAVARGITISRQYYAVDPLTLKPTSRPITSAKLGDYVQVKLGVTFSNDMDYVALEDPLPAGFEAVDSTLATSSTAAASGELTSEQNYHPYWWYWGHSEIRDDRVALFADSIAGGTYEYSYIIRASVAGTFHTLPARAYPMYDPLPLGQTAGSLFTITP